MDPLTHSLACLALQPGFFPKASCPAVLAIAAFLFSHTLRDPQRSTRWMGLSWSAVAAAALLHLLMDFLQTDPVSLLWPFSPKRLSFDVSPSIDPWLIVVLASAILFPELLRLLGAGI